MRGGGGSGHGRQEERRRCTSRMIEAGKCIHGGGALYQGAPTAPNPCTGGDNDDVYSRLDSMSM
jgi:hypothetical protein